MKRIILKFALYIPLILLFSCSGNDDSPDAVPDLIGTWVGISTIFGNDEGPNNNTVTFTADNRIELIIRSTADNGQDVFDFGEWSRNGNTLTINWDNGGNSILTITELTQNSLIWESTISTFRGDGILIQTFSRQ
ncbi:MAG: lipocalin family protein [Bacteroidota bacterium]